ncbi:MAG: hypothetical protein QF847_08470 [Candidatus Marinimicrobia bacterium]|jgi:hypothetical protein|nr:hypothetical protein [Candidatus Neomarinimicrobiota bacterium]MDP6727261.1 hypothetical protein [Candidatus Neomarinimicrobiota bacterium]|tara:strand:- start:877 stop:1008 length:132 start_codon:yes stop_codon:yes gene_type:complete
MAKITRKFSLPPSHPLFSRGFSIISLRKPIKPKKDKKDEKEKK